MKQLLTVLLIAVIAISVNAQCNIEFTTNQIGDELQIVGQGVNETITTTTDVDFNGVGIIEFTYSGSNGSSFSYNCNGVNYSSGIINDGFIYIENAVLPVELNYFQLQKIESGISLKWETSSESNNRGFYIEKSIDGNAFKTLGFVDGGGTILESKEYSFTDSELLKGTSYYRLKQVDFDGQFEYSKVISVNYEPTTTPFLLTTNVVSNSLELEGVGDLVITNQFGQQLKRINSTGNSLVDISDLANGIYNITLLSNRQTIRFLKVN